MHITQCVSCLGTCYCSPLIPLKGSAAEPILEDWIEPPHGSESHTAMPLKCHCPATDLPFWYFYPALGFHLARAIPVSCFDIYICNHRLGTRTEPQGSAQGQCFHLALFVVRFGGESWENCPVWAFSTFCCQLRQREVGVGRWFSLPLEKDRVFCMGGQYRINIFSL